MNPTDIGSDARTRINCWARLRTTFGPTAAGLLGGAFLGLAGLYLVQPLCRNVAATYAEYPSLTRPAIAAYRGLPAWLSFLALMVGILAPVGTGAVVVWLARPRDIWADLSAGLSAALACTLSAFATCIGWLVVLAMVVVPSISDLTLLSESVRSPAGKHPSQELAARYPDLKSVEPDERGAKFMPKIVSDQVSGGIQSVWVGLLMALLTAGSLAMCGTLAAGYLMRRGGGFPRLIMPYLEITVPLTVTVAIGAATALSGLSSWSVPANPYGFGPATAAGLVVASAILVVGALRCWPWLPRLCLAATWLILLTQPGRGALQGVLPILSGALTAILLVRLGVAHSRQLAPATP